MLNDATPLEFMSLRDLLREKRTPSVPARTEVEESKPARPRASCGSAEIASFVEEIALLRLRVVESFERSRKTLLHRFAEEVLARELQLQPVDIEAIARKVLAAFADEDLISVVVCPADAACLRGYARVRVDESLEPGDFIADVCDGHLESPLRLRVARTLQDTLREQGAL